jgi:hypothetical protein
MKIHWAFCSPSHLFYRASISEFGCRGARRNHVLIRELMNPTLSLRRMSGTEGSEEEEEEEEEEACLWLGADWRNF